MIPYPLKWLLKKNLKLFIKITSPLRITPDFIIIGVQRGGTTSLFRYLIQHPNIHPPKDEYGLRVRNEIAFFDYNYHRGMLWYKSHFPTVFTKYYYKKILKDKFLSGETNPTHLLNTLVPERISKIKRKIKFIVLLRNPVDRAHSHYYYEKSMGLENLTMEEAIKQEEKRIVEKSKLKDPIYSNLVLFSYLSAGKYLEQLKFWFNFFPREQFLILKSEDLFSQPSETVQKVFEFLQLSKYNSINYKQHNPTPFKAKMDTNLKNYLKEYFKPFNDELNKFFNRDFQWD